MKQHIKQKQRTLFEPAKPRKLPIRKLPRPKCDDPRWIFAFQPPTAAEWAEYQAEQAGVL